jgi:hypothetical protein
VLQPASARDVTVTASINGNTTNVGVFMWVSPEGRSQQHSPESLSYRYTFFNNRHLPASVSHSRNGRIQDGEGASNSFRMFDKSAFVASLPGRPAPIRLVSAGNTMPAQASHAGVVARKYLGRAGQTAREAGVAAGADGTVSAAVGHHDRDRRCRNPPIPQAGRYR